MPETSTPENIRKEPVGQVVDNLMKETQEALESGTRVTANLNELKRRAEEATDWRKQLNRHGGIVAGLVAGTSLLLFLLIRRR
jgi:hypothetical protein